MIKNPRGNSASPRCWVKSLVVLSIYFFVLTLGCDATSEKTGSSSNIPSKRIERKSNKGPVDMLVRLSPMEPRLSDLVDLDIEVSAEAEVLIVPPVFGQAVGDFLVRDYTERTPSKAGEQSKPNRRIFHYQLEPVHTGVHLIRSIAIEFVDNREESEQKGQTVWIESEPIEVVVSSEFGDQVPDLANLEPMAPPLSLDDSAFWVWIACAAFFAAFLAAFFLKRRSRTALVAEYQPTAEEIAHSQLARLLAENLPSQGMFKDFYLRLTGIVRIYIEGITGLRAPEQTTEEFLREMGKREVFSSDQSNRLKEFLEAADMVKYAGQTPDLNQIDNSIVRAKEFIDMKPRVEGPSMLQASHSSVSDSRLSERGS